MNIIEILVSAVIGFLIAWYFFGRDARESRKKYHDLEKLIERLPDEVIEKLKTSPREKLTVKQLNKLIEEKTVDKNKEGLGALKCCPKCGSPKIWVGTNFDPYIADENGTIEPNPYEEARCPKCGWSKDEMGNEFYYPIKKEGCNEDKNLQKEQT